MTLRKAFFKMFFVGGLTGQALLSLWLDYKGHEWTIKSVTDGWWPAWVTVPLALLTLVHAFTFWVIILSKTRPNQEEIDAQVDRRSGQ